MLEIDDKIEQKKFEVLQRSIGYVPQNIYLMMILLQLIGFWWMQKY